RRHEAPQLLRPGCEPREPQEAPGAGRDRRVRHAGAGLQGCPHGRSIRQLPHHHAEPRGGRRRRRAQPAPREGRRARTIGWPRVRAQRGQDGGGVVTTLTMKKADGADGRSIELPDDVFGIEPNTAVMHQVVTAQLAAKRAGTHSTKTRAEVRGGGAKPWRQKGTGRARQGSIRSPQWRGGGVAHGPHPRDYTQRTPKKMIRLALRSALSDRAAEGKLIVVDDWGVTEPKTKSGVQLLVDLGLRNIPKPA